MEKREELYYILKEYLADRYTSAVFADVMFSAFYPDRPFGALSQIEFEEFNRLAEAASRFSRYEEDFINCPNAFISSEELFSTAAEVYQNLVRGTDGGSNGSQEYAEDG